MDTSQLELLLRKYAHVREKDYVGENAFPRTDMSSEEGWVSAISEDPSGPVINFEAEDRSKNKDDASTKNLESSNTQNNPEMGTMENTEVSDVPILNDLSQQDVRKLVIGVIQSTLDGNIPSDKVGPLSEQIFTNISGFLNNLYGK